MSNIEICETKNEESENDELEIISVGSDDEEDDSYDDPFVSFEQNYKIKKELAESKYDIKRIAKMIDFPRTIVVCGPSGSGKSQMIKYLYKENKDEFDFTIVFSGSYFDLEFKDEGIPDLCHQKINETKINAVIEVLKYFKSNDINFKVLLIFDDVTGNINLQHNALIDQIVTSCRHYNCSTIIAAHWLSKLSRTILESVKFFFIFQSTREALSRIREYTNYKEEELWDLYLANMDVEYSFMFIQKIKPSKKMIYFCKPIPNIAPK